jgi:hypothetical protein
MYLLIFSLKIHTFIETITLTENRLIFFIDNFIITYFLSFKLILMYNYLVHATFTLNSFSLIGVQFFFS